ncbi:hypothetical protein [Nostoc sp.]|uniref:hypothetical protein n=1 Tax=Nostoc sp. TaxID=1180 RepID=UPI002FF7D309
MESTLFTALSTNEEANLSGGYYFYNSGIIVKQDAKAYAKGYYPYAYASNSSNITVY